MTYVTDVQHTITEESRPEKQESPKPQEPEAEVPEEVTVAEPEEPAKGHGIPFIWFLLIPAFIVSGLLLFIIFGVLKRERDEEQ